MASLSVPDYVVFGLTLGISASIGIFFAIKDRKKSNDVEDYMLGGRNLSTIPVALSLSVSFMSAITVLGTPADIYLYGTMYWWFLLALLIVVIITSEIYIPTFYKMGISSTYEYLDERFNKSVRLAVTLTYLLQTIFYIGIVIYAPSLALSLVTGLDLWTSVLSTGCVCIFYTALGGIKAVVWTDAFQACIMLIGFLAVLIKGSIDVGGFKKVWEICAEDGRIDFVHFEGDPRIRHSFWSVVVGGTFLWLGIYAVSQSQVQRYLCCPSIKSAKRAIYLNWVGLFFIITLCCMNGLVMYAYFRDCDPLTAGQVSATDQLLPYLSLQLFEKFPGLTGVVISCIFSGSLSTVSSGINAMSCVTVEDIIRPQITLSNRQLAWLSKISVIVYGALCIAMAYVASVLGEVLQAALSILGMTGGPMLGVFSMGLLFPFTNSFGALAGLLSGLAGTIWVYVGKEFYPPDAEFANKLYLDCINATTTIAPNVTDIYNSPDGEDIVAPGIANLYAMSYAYYSLFGFVCTTVVGVIVSFATGGWNTRNSVEKRFLYNPFDHFLLSWLPDKLKSSDTNYLVGAGYEASAKKSERFVESFEMSNTKI